jgi:type VI secretion system secreted protein Hcp
MPVSPASAGSGDCFLSVQAKRAGKVKGESAVPGHEDEIAVSSWRWGVQASSNLGATAATARRSYSGLTVVKAIDAASTALLAALATNDEIKEAVLTMRKAGGEAVDYFFIKLEQARVTQVEHATNEQGDTREEVTFAFRKVEVEYRRQAGSGGRGASHVFTDEIVPSA